MNNLSDRPGGGIFDRDPAAEASVAALGASGFSTDRLASQGVTRILGQLPNLSDYGISPGFTPEVVQLMQYQPYDTATGRPNVSEGAGLLDSNHYTTDTQFQPQGVLNSRERGSGVSLPAPGGPIIQRADPNTTLAG